MFPAHGQRHGPPGPTSLFYKPVDVYRDSPAWTDGVRKGQVMGAETSTGRLHALDAVRAGALLLGVAFHAALPYLPGPQLWMVRDAPNEGIGIFFYVSHLFRMTLFFVIAGFFGRMLLQRRGTRGFVANRTKRIMLPLFVFWPIVISGIVACMIWGAAAMNGGTLPAKAPPPPAITPDTFPLTHLWFLYLLILFYAAALALHGLAMLVDRDERLRTRIVDPAMRLVTATPASAPLLAAPLGIALIWAPNWMGWFGIPTPDTGLFPNAAALTGFGTAFAFGWLLERQRPLLMAVARWWPAHLVVAVALTIACLAQIGTTPVVTPMAADDARNAYALCYALAVWSWTLGLIGAALTFLSGERPAIRYVADASYWIYLIHLPVVMALQVAIFGLGVPALVKWGIVTGGAFLILFASYHLLVRHSWIGKWLNGRKLAWGAAKPGMEMQTA
jgi:glucans biosynthesis protein C